MMDSAKKKKTMGLAKQGQVNEAINDEVGTLLTIRVPGRLPYIGYIYNYRPSGENPKPKQKPNRRQKEIVLTRIDIAIRKLSAPVKIDATDIPTSTSSHVLMHTI